MLIGDGCRFMAETQLYSVPMYRAANRVMTIFGGERELMLMVILVSVSLIVTGLTWLTTISGALGLTTGVFLLRMMADKDPLMSKVFMRYWFRHSQPIFAASSAPGSNGFRIPGGVKE